MIAQFPTGVPALRLFLFQQIPANRYLCNIQRWLLSHTRYAFFEREENRVQRQFSDKSGLYQSCIVPMGYLQSVPVTTGGSLQIAVHVHVYVHPWCVRTYASVRIDCTLPVNWCSKILAIPEHKMQGVPLGGWYVAGKIGGISNQCHDVWYGY